IGTEERIVGIARYDRSPDTKQAEVAVLVHDAYQQRGLGTAMLTTLADIARENGIETLEADVLPYNQRMLEVLLHLGYRLEAGSAKRTGLVRLLKPLKPATES
ncbi:MAG TPA: GNAT family N-acetyltransferase, partial [Dehalococcoidia bacterium]|nr:GNAT family N-acetyltransferase [Dehalococcoidia bacterium]